MSEVAILSIFGRGHWLAGHLAEKGVKVELVDVSQKLGPWAPEDWEGPFGFFQIDGLEPGQLERVHVDDDLEAVENGLCVMTPNGPLEFSGPLAAHWATQMGLEGDVLNYIRKFSALDDEAQSKINYRFERRPFAETWLACLAHQLASTIYRPNALARGIGEPLNLTAPHFVRRVSRRGYEKSLSSCESKGAKVIRAQNLVDLQLDTNSLTSVEIQSDRSGALQADHFVWCLTSEETEFFGEKLIRPFFPKGSLRPQWAWVRYQINLQPGIVAAELPTRILFVNNIYLPWTHSHLIILQRTVKTELWDAWIRVPSSQRFKTEYLQQQGELLVSQLAGRWPTTEPRIHQMPQDFIYDSSRLGPTRFPVYDEEERKGLRIAGLRNVFFDSPETWDRQDWTGQFQKQKLIADILKKRVADTRAKAERAKARKAAHPGAST